MKKVLLSINRHFSNFLIMLIIVSFFLIYVMFKVPVVYWIGNMAGRNFTDNFGSSLISFLKNDYLAFILFPFLPFLGLFILLSIFIRIYYRQDKETARTGFTSLIIGLVAVFALIYLPARASIFSSSIDEKRAEEINFVHNSDLILVNKNIGKEFYKLYQTLADENIQPWRKDPVAVVKYELEKGDLTYISHGENTLTLESTEKDEQDKITKATVELKNERLNAEIYLNSYWEVNDGIWTVKSYKLIKQVDF